MSHYSLIETIAIPPKNPESYDIGWVDQGSEMYYLTDRTNSGVDVIDSSSGAFVRIIPGFVRPNGILAIPGEDQLWVGDGDGTVKGVDLGENQVIAKIPTGGSNRADELAYDPRDGLILVGNDAEDPPFAALISPKERAVVARIPFPRGTEGLEQPVWNPGTNRFYISVPRTPANPGGEIDVIDPSTAAITSVIPLTDCRPHGLALGPDQKLLACCSSGVIREGAKARTYILDARSGEVLETIFEVGGSDEVWFNPGDERFYLAAGGMTSDGTNKGTPTPVMGVVDSRKNTWVANVPTAKGSHSVAVNPRNNHAYVPFGAAGIGVFAEV